MYFFDVTPRIRPLENLMAAQLVKFPAQRIIDVIYKKCL
jgi:hypothetical protein